MYLPGMLKVLLGGNCKLAAILVISGFCDVMMAPRVSWKMAFRQVIVLIQALLLAQRPSLNL